MKKEKIVLNIKKEDEYDVSVKWDGCVNLTYHGDYVHICDLDNYIKQLTEIQEKAIEYFGKEWN